MSQNNKNEAWIAVMVQPRGGLLDGEHALVLNQEVFPTREAAQRRADGQASMEAIFSPTLRTRFAVLNVGGAA